MEKKFDFRMILDLKVQTKLAQFSIVVELMVPETWGPAVEGDAGQRPGFLQT